MLTEDLQQNARRAKTLVALAVAGDQLSKHARHQSVSGRYVFAEACFHRSVWLLPASDAVAVVQRRVAIRRLSENRNVEDMSTGKTAMKKWLSLIR